MNSSISNTVNCIKYKYSSLFKFYETTKILRHRILDVSANISIIQALTGLQFNHPHTQTIYINYVKLLIKTVQEQIIKMQE